MSNIKQYYDIKFPFTSNNNDGFFLDLNKGINDKILSEILHVIMTRKNTRLRMPDFGTDLTKYIFEPNDSETWNSIKSEIKKAVSTYVPMASINDIKVYRDENGEDNSIFVNIDYNVKKGVSEENNNVTVKI